MRIGRAAVVVGALAGAAAAATTVNSTMLIVARNDDEAAKASLGLDGYGIPWEKVLIPQNGGPLPTLNASQTTGRYGGIVTLGALFYDINGTFQSALTPQQWEQLYAYQTAFRVRMVRINEFPAPQFGATPAIANTGCCQNNAEQRISLTSTQAFPGAKVKTNAPMSTRGIWHYPANITDTNAATEIASFEPSGAFASKTTAAVVHKTGGRETMVWFLDWVPSWSPMSAFLQHAYIHWMTRGLFVGKRKVHLSAQVDDVHLSTGLYLPSGTSFRLRPEDLDAHVAWQCGLAQRLPAGSDFWLELGHNGNGDIEAAVNTTWGKLFFCQPPTAVQYTARPDTPLEFVKPPGTGVDLWSPQFTSYPWGFMCAFMDSLAAWFLTPARRDAFAHVSHTFTHEELNNATYRDAALEISFNQAWLRQLSLASARRFSPSGIIPPAITGLHNADALRAWADNGIRYVVGDNTRLVLRNPQSPFWPLNTTVAANGFDGIVIVPRLATTIYYNCDTPACTLQEWKDTSAGAGEFPDLLDNARQVNTRNLLGLRADPYMFHQANMRQVDMNTSTVGTKTGKMSLVMSWVETITQEMVRLTDWPLTSLKHDDLARYFMDRMALDACKPKASSSPPTPATAAPSRSPSPSPEAPPRPRAAPPGRTRSAASRPSSGSPWPARS